MARRDATRLRGEERAALGREAAVRVGSQQQPARAPQVAEAAHLLLAVGEGPFGGIRAISLPLKCLFVGLLVGGCIDYVL